MRATCCFQGNLLGTRQIAFLPLDPEVTRDNAFKVSKALRHPCLKFHLKFLCYCCLLLLYPVFNITKLSPKQPISSFVGTEPCTSCSSCRDLAAGCQGRQGEQGCDAGQGTVQCLAVHEIGPMRVFLLSSFFLSPLSGPWPRQDFLLLCGFSAGTLA